MDEIINDEYIEETTISYNGIMCRDNSLQEIKNKFELLWKTVEYLCGKTLNSPTLTITGNKLKYSTCICSCNKCNEVYEIQDEDTDIYFAVGSSCIKKFSNKKLDTELYYETKAKRCLQCNDPLVVRDNNYIPINCKKGDNFCNECKYEKIYLNVPYEKKENAKAHGAMWNPILKKWYIYRNNNNYDYLTNKYKTP